MLAYFFEKKAYKNDGRKNNYCDTLRTRGASS